MPAVTDSSAGLVAYMTGSRSDLVKALVTGGARAVFWEVDPAERRFGHADVLACLLGIRECTAGVTVRLGKVIAGDKRLSLHFRIALAGMQDATVVLDR